MNKKILFIIPGICFVLFSISILQKPDYSPDDTYIYMQYARNIADGNGFSFNAGEQSYGVTSPLWVFLISVPYWLGYEGYWFSKFTDLFAALLSVFVFFRLCGFFFNENRILRYLATGLFILNAWLVRWAFTGMETSFAVLLVLLIFYMFYSGRYYLMFFLCGLMYLTRPESSILTVLLFIIVIYRELKDKKFNFPRLLAYTGLTALTIVPFFIFAKLSFGTVLPNTALGKSTLTLSPVIIFNQITEIIKTLSAAGIIEMCLTAVFLVLVLKNKNTENTFPMLLWIAGLVFLYTVTDADIISRYLLIISPFIIISGVKALEYFKEKQVYAVLTVFIISVFYSQFIFYKFVKPSTQDFTKGVNECFIPAGEWLGNNTPGNSRILVNDVGAIGYFSNRYIIDAAALINRDLELNKVIMSAPLEERMETHKLLKYIEADYVIDRDTSESGFISEFEKYKLNLEFVRKFPSLGISDPSPRFYKIYKVTKQNIK